MKTEFGERISIMVIDALGLPTHILNFDNSSNSEYINEINLAKSITVIDTTRHSLNIGTSSFTQLISFLDNMEKDYKNLYKLIKENGNKQEIEILKNKIVESQRKSLKTFKDIQKFIEEFKNQGNGDKEKYLMWYNNDAGRSNELVKIIDTGLK
ncbi:hypothetical protein [Maledivibacter halophilus]|uniref:Uncharacterized protein n=1 Tax=Maledivibacter halophilus TaxID=36842 RepID=A0A1T5MNQ4_9FIRM|nr:hypothetical protein [Maledivibacter halophilus]SKC89860.1 hypothetical protein SAMN02194393_05088 [Maledivibacter halophilus]